jgi:hypothetical protein
MGMPLETEKEFLERMQGLNNDHFHDGWPAVQMRDINRLLEIIGQRDKALTEQAKDYAQRHIGFANELRRFTEKEDSRDRLLCVIISAWPGGGWVATLPEKGLIFPGGQEIEPGQYYFGSRSDAVTAVMGFEKK